MNDTPDDPRLPEPGGGDDDTTPIEPADELPAEMPAEPPYDSVELPPLAPLGDDLPPLDGDGDPPKRRLLSGGRLAIAAVLALVLLGGAAFAVTSGGDDDSDDGTDGIASVDGGEGDDDDEDDDSSGSGDRPSEEEMQDAMLEFAECMREHGIDMPDPEFTEDGGGFSSSAAPGDAMGPDSEEFEAADEACSSIMEEVRGEMTPPSPEEIAEMQDKLVAMAQCMRDKGHDMPDPQVSSDGGGMAIAIGGPGEGGGPQAGEEDEWMADQEACSEEAGLEGGPSRMAPAGGDD